MSNGEKYHGDQQAAKCKKECREQGEWDFKKGSENSYVSDTFKQKPEGSKGLSYQLPWGKQVPGSIPASAKALRQKLSYLVQGGARRPVWLEQGEQVREKEWGRRSDGRGKGEIMEGFADQSKDLAFNSGMRNHWNNLNRVIWPLTGSLWLLCWEETELKESGRG